MLEATSGVGSHPLSMSVEGDGGCPYHPDEHVLGRKCWHMGRFFAHGGCAPQIKVSEEGFISKQKRL